MKLTTLFNIGLFLASIYLIVSFFVDMIENLKPLTTALTL